MQALEPPDTYEPSPALLRRKRYRFRRRHTPHFYLVVCALSSAGLLSGLDLAAYLSREVALATVAFWATCVVALIVFASYFYGFFMLMNGNIPPARIRTLAPHAIVGTLSPLVYALNVSIGLDTLGHRPLSIFALITAVVSCLVLAVQFSMGRRVVRVERPRLLRLHE